MLGQIHHLAGHVHRLLRGRTVGRPRCSQPSHGIPTRPGPPSPPPHCFSFVCAERIRLWLSPKSGMQEAKRFLQNTHGIDRQFMIGPSILVTPCLEKVWLPSCRGPGLGPNGNDAGGKDGDGVLPRECNMVLVRQRGSAGGEWERHSRRPVRPRQRAFEVGGFVM